MDPQLRLFRRQYLQLFEPDFLAWPPKPLLLDATCQAWLHSSLFDPNTSTALPPERYQLRVLKLLVARIEKAIEDPSEHVSPFPPPPSDSATVGILLIRRRKSPTLS